MHEVRSEVAAASAAAAKVATQQREHTDDMVYAERDNLRLLVTRQKILSIFKNYGVQAVKDIFVEWAEAYRR